MTDEWQSLTHRFAMSGHKGYVTVATDRHGRPVLLEIRRHIGNRVGSLSQSWLVVTLGVDLVSQPNAYGHLRDAVE